MPNPDNSVEILLDTLKNNFLAEVPERCALMEDYILALEKEQMFPEAFKNLFRSIHSLKGTGGTMGLPIITAISHQFEDVLSDIDGDFKKIKQDSIDSMLKYNDLLNSTVTQLVNHQYDGELVVQKLNALKISTRRQEAACILIEPSRMLARVITKEFKNLPIHFTTIDNGLGALERLLNEKFDLLITSKELPILNGIALISALRKSEVKNANIPVILTTSKNINSLSLDDLDIFSVVQKNQMLVKKLKIEFNAVSTKIHPRFRS